MNLIAMPAACPVGADLNRHLAVQRPEATRQERDAAVRRIVARRMMARVAHPSDPGYDIAADSICGDPKLLRRIAGAIQEHATHGTDPDEAEIGRAVLECVRADVIRGITDADIEDELDAMGDDAKEGEQ